MDFSDIKLLIINGAALLVSFSDIEIILKICLLTVSIGYTITKWKDIYKNEKNK
jgi:proteasome assembly chaperone (PAC2) family protein